jgi:hypothetical protein
MYVQSDDMNVGHVINNKTLWNLKMSMPLKIKIFMWYLIKGVVWTKDNLAKQNGEGNLRYSLCSNLETIHLLYFSVVAMLDLFGDFSTVSLA